ncbi:MAG: ERF family protein [Mycobacterium sp.]
MTTAAKENEAPPTVFQALQSVMLDVKAIGKDSTNADQGYKFRGIDAVMTAVHPILAEHGVFFLPNVIERVPEQRTTNNGKQMNVMHLHVEFSFYGPAGDHVTASTWGEGADMADKATNKAMSAALKYALVQVLCIPSADMLDEADKTTEEASKASDPAKMTEIEVGLEQATTVAELRVLYSTVTLAHRAKQLTPADKKAWHEKITDRVKELEAAPITAAELPKNSDGSVSHSQAMDSDLAAVGIMTAEQRKEHNALQEKSDGKIVRSTPDPAADPWATGEKGTLDLPDGPAAQFTARLLREIADCATADMVETELKAARVARRDGMITQPQLGSLVAAASIRKRELEHTAVA